MNGVTNRATGLLLRRISASRGRVRRRTRAALVALVAIVAATGILVASPLAAAPAAHAADRASLTWSVTLGGRDVLTATSNKPIRLVPDAGSTLVIVVHNDGTVPIAIRGAVFEGRVIGLPFFSYKTTMNVTVAPGAQGVRQAFPLDLSDLGDQANGLIPARVRLLGDGRQVLATKNFVVDVRGRIMSVYGIFGLVIAIVTVMLALGVVFALARRKLPRNRWQRATQFLPAGAGIGFVATFTFSATRLLTPSATLWVPLVLLCAGGAFALGYLAPGPLDESADVQETSTRTRRGRQVATAVGVSGVTALMAHDAATSGDVGTYEPYEETDLHGDHGP